MYSIGYGKDNFAEFIARIREHGTTHLVDVRTNPYSRYQEDFRGAEFAKNVEAAGLKYVFMGDRLGGKPEWPEVLVEGALEPALLRADQRWREAVDRLLAAEQNPNRVLMLMCGCSQPHECHRGRVLGEDLLERGVDIQHVLPTGEIVAQSILRVRAGLDQLGLFDAS